jgi:hypothetical protein
MLYAGLAGGVTIFAEACIAPDLGDAVLQQSGATMNTTGTTERGTTESDDGLSTTTMTAATFLDVTPNRLRMWEQQFAFPRSICGHDHHRRFEVAEILALKIARQRDRPDAQTVADARGLLGRLQVTAGR